MFKLTPKGNPVIIFEVEATKNPNMAQNACKIFNSKSRDVGKPWFFFHVVYFGTAGGYSNSLDCYKEFSNYSLIENVAIEENKKEFIAKLHNCVSNIFPNIGSEDIWNRFNEDLTHISDPVIQKALKEQLVGSLNLPTELCASINSGELTVDQSKKLA